MNLFFVHQQPQIPTFENFLNGIKLGACHDKLVDAGLDEDTFGKFASLRESVIDEAIREYPLNATQKGLLKDGIFELRKSLGMYIHSSFRYFNPSLSRSLLEGLCLACDIHR